MIDGVDYDLSMRRPRKTLLAPQAKLRRCVYADQTYRLNFLYLIRCGMTESVPSRRILSFS